MVEERHHLPMPCLVVLVGPSGSGKSTWAAAQFPLDEVVSSDRLRAVVGHGEDDLDASGDAFALLDTIVEQRLRRGLTTVVDSLGLDDTRRRGYREVAARHGVPCVAVAFDVPSPLARARNRERARPLPVSALNAQLARGAAVRDRLDDEGFAAVLRPGPVRLVPAHLGSSAPLAAEQCARPVGLRFGLHVSAFPWSPADTSGALRDVAHAAEAAGFESLWVMDHVRQIPQIGRDWDPMLESYTTLAWLAAHTRTVRLGALVTAITFRNVAHLAKIVASLDVLSGGRVTCGLGLAWYEREHRAYGWEFPSTDERYALLEDALEVLPLLWGPGSPSFEGRRLSVPEAIGYPRPVQHPLPLLLGGGGERRTLRLAARHAHAVNVMGDASTVARKRAVLADHCRAVGRDPGAIEVTHLAPTLVGADRAELDRLVEHLRPPRATPARYGASVHAGTVEDQVGRFRELAHAGVRHAIVSFPDLAPPGDERNPIERFAPVIDAFAGRAV